MRYSSCVGCAVLTLLLLLVTSRTLAQTAAPTAPVRARSGPVATSQPASQPAAPATRTVTALLSRKIPEFRVDDLPLSDVFDKLRDLLQVNVVVHWSRLAEDGVEPNKPVTLRVTNLPVRTILGLVLSEAAGSDAHLAYRASADLILITTAAEFASQMLVRTYDVEDLIAGTVAAPSFFMGTSRTYVDSVEPVVGNTAGLVRPITRDWWSGVGGWYGGRGEQGHISDNGRERRLRELIDVIKNVIEPETWDTHGGRGTISTLGGRLIVRNSPLVHQLIGGPLSDEGE